MLIKMTNPNKDLDEQYSNDSEREIVGEVVAEIALRADGQTVEKTYNNCLPMVLADEVGAYKLVRVDDGRNVQTVTD